MKILAIRGRNLASLEGEFEIDFTVEPLLSAGIFAISGPTGAGKSTLLDAMCLALFARTPRTDQAKENNVKLQDVNNEQLSQSDPRFLLRRGTVSGYAEVDFVALDGHRYRARWSVARARDKENGRLQSPRLTLFNLDREEEQQGTRSELQARIVELIGLTFEQFTRSVLLAQNDFSTFLKADQGEKASLLEKLTGTELYSAISRRIFDRNTRAKEALDEVRLRIRGIELLPEEEEERLRLCLAEVEQALARVEKAKAEQQQLQEGVRTVGLLIDTRKRQQKEATDKLKHATELLEVARREYEKGMEQQQASEVRFESLRQEIRQARKLDVQLDTAVRDLSVSERQLRSASERKKEAEEKYRAAVLRQKQGAEEIVRLKAWRERFREKESIAEQLSMLLLHLDAASAARTGAEAAGRSIVAIHKEKTELDKQLNDLQQMVTNKRQALRQAEEEHDRLDKKLKAVDLPALDRQTEALRQEREHLLIEQARQEASGNIKELRARLRDGQPCPVCGSTHHPLATHPVADTQRITSLTLQLQALSKQKEAYAEDSRRLTRLQQDLLRFHKELSDSETACKDISGKQQLADSRLIREKETEKERTARMVESLSAADALFGNAEWQKSWRQNPEAFRKTLTGFARQWQENMEKLRQQERQEGALKAECESLASFLPSVGKLHEEAVSVHEKNRAAFATLKAERGKLLEGRPADVVEQEYARKADEWKERLKKLLAVQTEQSGIAEQTRGIAGQIEKDLAEASADWAVRKAALDKWNTDFLASSDGQPLEAVLLRRTQEKADLTFRLRSQTENKGKIAGMQKELDARLAESERWAKLNELAGSADGAKFRRIAQGYTLDVLLNYANIQLRALTHRYRLERVPETLALQVIDRDMCDEVRTVHSLSGGESFLVSLALALGLSSLSSNRMKVESLFIDEGFGSLDAETLRVAMDTLESLRTQGRKIGVISHVQEMTERIPARICVNRAGNGRSFLEIR